MEEQKSPEEKNIYTNELVPMVTKIGGIFFFTNNPEQTRDWYRQNLV